MSGAKNGYSSFEELYMANHKMIFNYVRRCIRNNEAAAEDLTQEVFFVAYEKWEMLKGHPNIPGFLMVVAKNKIKKWYSKQNKYYVDEEEILDIMSEDVQEVRAPDAYRMVDFYSSVENTLSDNDLSILRHYYEYGYTSSEMAKKLGITESCFKVRVLRMKEKLKNSMRIFILVVFIGVCRTLL
ncbi:MAG: sigma-70 family RNA polymerase sigma factor [Lachnospiraceae bacterium]|nr:sigma-70 family RNA polymerase sigma factor [Lachnospiraceae bacterium]